jgi:hypothetical protein
MLRDFTASEGKTSHTQAEKSSGCATVRGWGWDGTSMAGNGDGSVSNVPVLLNAVHDVAEIIHPGVIYSFAKSKGARPKDSLKQSCVGVQKRNKGRRIARVKVICCSELGKEREGYARIKRLCFIQSIKAEMREGVSEAAHFLIIAPHCNRPTCHNRRHQRRQNKSLFHGLNEVGCIRRTNRERPINLRGCRV